jgi:hypothetical protein
VHALRLGSLGTRPIARRLILGDILHFGAVYLVYCTTNLELKYSDSEMYELITNVFALNLTTSISHCHQTNVAHKLRYSALTTTGQPARGFIISTRLDRQLWGHIWVSESDKHTFISFLYQWDVQ